MALVVSSNAPMKSVQGTYVTGSGVQISTIRWEWVDLSALANNVVPIFNSQIGTTKSGVETNMSRAGQIEKGRNFTVKQIGLRLAHLVAAAEATPEWVNDILATLFRYGMIQFKISGSDHIGQFPLALLNPTVAMASAAGAVNLADMAPVWIDLGDNEIVLSEQVDFKLELIVNIPATAPVTAIPAATHALFMLKGVEVFSQL